jgi:Ca2+/H+ antiporter
VPTDSPPSADGTMDNVAALINANAATARLEAFIAYLLMVRGRAKLRRQKATGLIWIKAHWITG